MLHQSSDIFCLCGSSVTIILQESGFSNPQLKWVLVNRNQHPNLTESL
jgi:hypothetical protein